METCFHNSQLFVSNVRYKWPLCSLSPRIWLRLICFVRSLWSIGQLFSAIISTDSPVATCNVVDEKRSVHAKWNRNEDSGKRIMIGDESNAHHLIITVCKSHQNQLLTCKSCCTYCCAKRSTANRLHVVCSTCTIVGKEKWNARTWSDVNGGRRKKNLGN